MTRQKLDDYLEDLESLGISSISVNEFNDTFELENLCERIKQSFYEAYKETYSD
jgi:hypothetical protein